MEEKCSIVPRGTNFMTLAFWLFFVLCGDKHSQTLIWSNQTVETYPCNCPNPSSTTWICGFVCIPPWLSTIQTLVACCIHADRSKIRKNKLDRNDLMQKVKGCCNNCKTSSVSWTIFGMAFTRNYTITRQKSGFSVSSMCETETVCSRLYGWQISRVAVQKDTLDPNHRCRSL